MKVAGPSQKLAILTATDVTSALELMDPWPSSEKKDMGKMIVKTLLGFFKGHSDSHRHGFFVGLARHDTTQ